MKTNMQNIGLNAQVAETIAQRVRIIRSYCNKTQVQFSKMLDIPQSTISQIECGQVTPSYDVLKKLNELGFDLEWIFTGHTSEKKLAKNKVVNSLSNWDRVRINSLLNKLDDDEVKFCRQWLELYVSSLKK